MLTVLRMKLECRISRSLLQGHWCHNNILLMDLKQKVFLKFFIRFLNFYPVYVVFLYELEGAIALSTLPLTPPVLVN